jgi:pimeloyl-ACP methyl ester carboxylesterase
MKRVVRILASLIALVLVAALVAAFVLDREKKTLSETDRAGAAGAFLQLSDGITQYELAGPDSGRTVVLLSGASVPFYIWDPTFGTLVANGFRVLRYNYFGRGFSDRPKLNYDLATYDAQLTGLLDSLGIRGTIDVVGLSMGGPVATYFANEHAERVRTLTLVAPGIGLLSETPFPAGIPLLGNFLLTLSAGEVAKSQLSDFLHPERHPDWVSRYEQQMQYKGFRRSILTTMRSDVLKRRADTFTKLAQSQIPILLIWGKEDRTVPFALSDTVRAAFPRAQFHAIDQAAHLPHIEQAALVDSILLRFLLSPPG